MLVISTYSFTTFIDIFCAIPVHAWVISIITLKPSVIRRDIRLCCLADQVNFIYSKFWISIQNRWPWCCTGSWCAYCWSRIRRCHVQGCLRLKLALTIFCFQFLLFRNYMSDWPGYKADFGSLNFLCCIFAFLGFNRRRLQLCRSIFLLPYDPVVLPLFLAWKCIFRLHNQVTVGSGTKWNIGSR